LGARPVPSIFSPGKPSPRSGFGDPYSLDPHYIKHVDNQVGNPRIRFADFLNGPWINDVSVGVNVGPVVLVIENYHSSTIWNLTRKTPNSGRSWTGFSARPSRDAGI